jgi:hypothetical protein
MDTIRRTFVLRCMILFTIGLLQGHVTRLVFRNRKKLLKTLFFFLYFSESFHMISGRPLYHNQYFLDVRRYTFSSLVPRCHALSKRLHTKLVRYTHTFARDNDNTFIARAYYTCDRPGACKYSVKY